MKRKRGSKKGKAKKPKVMATNEVASNAEEVNTGNDSVVEEELESDGSGSGGEDEGPSSTGTDQAQKPASANSGGFSDSTVIKAVYGRVKVKIKNSKALDSQVTTSETRTQNDAEKSFQYAGLEKQGVSSEKMEDSANSLSETNNVSTSGDLPKKSAGIKIKTKNFSSNISPCINAETLKGEKTHKKEPYSVSKDSRHNKKELDAAVEVCLDQILCFRVSRGYKYLNCHPSTFVLLYYSRPNFVFTYLGYKESDENGGSRAF